MSDRLKLIGCDGPLYRWPLSRCLTVVRLFRLLTKLAVILRISKGRDLVKTQRCSFFHSRFMKMSVCHLTSC